jgi:hypothetical protein
VISLRSASCRVRDDRACSTLSFVLALRALWLLETGDSRR